MSELSINADERRHTRHGHKPKGVFRRSLSAVTLVVSMGAVLFFGEMMVMGLLIVVPVNSPFLEAVIDSALLVLLVSPALYSFFYRPLRQRIEAQKGTEAEIRLLSSKLLHAAEEEQRKLALDLHDEFGQSISALKIALEELRKKVQSVDPKLSEVCAGPISNVDELHTSIRSLVARLRPSLLDDLGIEPALQWLVSELRRQNPDVEFGLEMSGLKTRPKQQMENDLFRISQEAISNALMHGKPRKIDLHLIASYPDLILTIRDDGTGFDSENAGYKLDGRVHFGLLSMRERTLSLHGRFTIISQPGEGTTIRVVLPQKVE
jgi:two-component system sensor histidine kinase UhpB